MKKILIFLIISNGSYQNREQRGKSGNQWGAEREWEENNFEIMFTEVFYNEHDSIIKVSDNKMDAMFKNSHEPVHISFY